MCGIAGILGPSADNSIERATRALSHRGPDGEGFYRDDRIALGHRRLSIIDLEGGAQPITNETGDINLVCNGEIYNSPMLRSMLIDRGHKFRTQTDVEVILHLYEEHGRDCVKYLQGMFAFAIWDCTTEKLMLARDHMGQKPLFFAQTGRNFVFASEVKGVLASGIVSAEIDLDGLWHYVSLRYLPDQYSLFSGIAKLPAATSLVVHKGEISLEKYWQPEFRDKSSGNLSSLTDELDVLLQNTVESHLLSDVRVGAFLSGGIDSSTIAALMARTSEGRVPAFSIGVEEQNFNELPFARMVAAQYEMEAHERIVKADLIRLLPSMVYHMDEPADPFGVGVYLVSKLASDHVKVVLTGDGGDENFAGYDRYLGQRLVDFYCFLPLWLRRSVMKPLIRRIPESFGYKSVALKAAWLNDMSFYSQGARYARSLSFLRFTHEAKEGLFSESARKSVQNTDSTEKVLDYFDARNAEDIVDRMLYTDLMTRMPDHLLAIVDRMSMAHSLETRAPMIDYKVVEFAASVPARWKLKGTDLKHILKRVARRHIPQALVDREKQGFSFPIAVWMRTDLQQFIRNLFRQSRFIENGIFSRDYVDKLIDEHMTGKIDHNYRLWILINLEYWYRLNFEGETPDSLLDFTEGLM